MAYQIIKACGFNWNFADNPGLFQVRCCGTSECSGGWGGGLWPFPSCEEDKVAKQPSSVGEVGNRPQPLSFDPRPLAGFCGWRAGPTSGLPAFALDHGPRTERVFFIETFGKPGTGGHGGSAFLCGCLRMQRSLQCPALLCSNYWLASPSAALNSFRGLWLRPQILALF